VDGNCFVHCFCTQQASSIFSSNSSKFISINGQKWDPWADPFFIIIEEKYGKLESHHLYYYPQNGHFSLVSSNDANPNQVEIRIAFKVSSKIPLFLEFDIADVEFYVELELHILPLNFFFENLSGT